jgi:hypothetical protein
MPFLAIALLALVLSGHEPEPTPPPPDRTHDELAHLPQAVRDGILAWRERLRNARCLKVVCETDETWRNMDRLDETGSPVAVLRERFQIHSWMTPDMLWMVVFPYSGESPDTNTPHYQLLWKQSSGTVWQRVWDADEKEYHESRYKAPGAFGAENGILDSQGCIYATVMQSWLTGGDDLADRSGIVSSVAFLRHASLSIVPPDPAAAGVWLDVFQDELVRDSRPDPDEVYRRNDFMLLARDETNQPELRAWRTIVLTDREHGGTQPQEITAMCRLSYEFFERVPEALNLATDAFRAEVETSVADSP